MDIRRPLKKPLDSMRDGQFLAWLSIGLAIPMLLAPKKMDHLIGVEPTILRRLFTRLVGARELAVGLGLLRNPSRSELRWARAAGDALDLVMLSVVPAKRFRKAFAAAAVAGIEAMDVLAGLEATPVANSR